MPLNSGDADEEPVPERDNPTQPNAALTQSTLLDALEDEDMDSDDLEWEDLFLLADRGAGRALLNALREDDEAAAATQGNERPMNAIPEPSVTPSPAETAAPFSFLVPNSRTEVFSYGVRGYPCPDLWEMDTLLTRGTENERGDASVTEQGNSAETRLGELLRNRGGQGVLGRQRRRSFDEERRVNAMRRHLRRCLERSTSIEQSAEKSENEDSLPEVDYQGPAYSSLLRPGLEFKGAQRCIRPNQRPRDSGPIEEWVVRVQIRRYDASSGYVCGTMAAYVKNNAAVETFWKGEIIDNKNHTFCTDKWSADRETDIDYWTKFEAFRDLKCRLQTRPWVSPFLKEYPYIFMRWKETHFLTKTEQNMLSIQGFYYICMCRQTGEMTGYYYDPHCPPFQELTLVPDRHGRPGHWVDAVCFEYY